MIWLDYDFFVSKNVARISNSVNLEREKIYDYFLQLHSPLHEDLAIEKANKFIKELYGGFKEQFNYHARQQYVRKCLKNVKEGYIY